MIAPAEPSPAFSMIHGALLTAVVIALACLIVRWILPLVLRTLLNPLQDTIDIVAAGMLLPEYWLSRASRHVNGSPPHLAYEYGNAVAWIARLAHSVIDRFFRGLAAAAHSVPLPLIAVVAGSITISQLII